MKTTIEITDALLAEAKRVANNEKTSVRALVEEGLHRVIDERAGRATFRLRKESFRGEGLQPGFSEGSWEDIRDAIYEGRGS